MIKTHWLVSSLILVLTLGSCSSTDNNQEPISEVDTQKITIDKLCIGLNNNKQFTPNAPLPVQAQINSKNKIEKITLLLKQDDTIIWQNTFTSIIDQLNTTIPTNQLSIESSPSSNFTIELIASDKNNISTSVVEQINFLDFTITDVNFQTILTQESEDN
ncbi:hypothetical protein, partial [Myroides sp. LoEW2-1]|uniref:hypothetical protein n=1 Tax=Myroides sp. LoEW2-1 TaxID=2683192 RepID=UPI0013238482